MESKEMKIRLIEHYLRMGYICAMTEFLTFGMCLADVFLVDKNYYPIEIEIKTGEFDLQGELNSIKHCLNNTDPSREFHTKYSKHLYYLSKNYSNHYINPSKFYFAVTENLYEQAQKQLTDSPYGLIVVPDNRNFLPRTVKKADKLHVEKIDIVTMEKYLKKVSRENLRLRIKYEF